MISVNSYFPNIWEKFFEKRILMMEAFLFESEKVASRHKYPKEYQGPKPITEQVESLAKIFGVDSSHALAFARNLPELPDGAEGWFAMLSPAALFPELKSLDQRYCFAANLIHQKLTASRPFYEYELKGRLDPVVLRVSARTKEAFNFVGGQQGGDILIVACQLGMRFRGSSVRRSVAAFEPREFGLTSNAVGCILLTHPERLSRFDELEMDCAGDEADNSGGRFSCSSCFFYGNDGQVRFSCHHIDSPNRYYGSASGFVFK